MTEQLAALAGRLTEDGLNVPTLGYIVFWNVENVKIGKQELAQKLMDVGLPTHYARERNYRSAFIRALRSLEEQRIIRKAEENADHLVYQFTSERKTTADGEAALDYERETVIVIDKNEYRESEDFAKALVRGRPDLRAKIIELFIEEKAIYRSSDVTRTLQLIFEREADLVSLRPQGAVYFVPFRHHGVVEAVTRLAASIPGVYFAQVPMLDVTAARRMLGGAVQGECKDVLEKLDEEIAEVRGQGASERWKAHRRSRLVDLQRRIEQYAEVLNGAGKDLLSEYEKVALNLSGVRVLDL